MTIIITEHVSGDDEEGQGTEQEEGFPEGGEEEGFHEGASQEGIRYQGYLFVSYALLQKPKDEEEGSFQYGGVL